MNKELSRDTTESILPDLEMTGINIGGDGATLPHLGGISLDALRVESMISADTPSIINASGRISCDNTCGLSCEGTCGVLCSDRACPPQ